MMRSVAIFAGCLAIGFLCLGEARVVADHEEQHGIMRSLKQGNACGNYEFKFNTDYPSGNPMNNGREAITESSEECCALCSQTEGCKTWTRIKRNTRYNRRGECWLRDHTPDASWCNHCDSGVAKSLDDLLDQCEEKGRTAGRVAVRGACSSLVSRCPPPTEEQKRATDARDESDEEATSARTRIEDVANRTCKVLFQNECQSEAFNKAFEDGGDCSDILTYGPAPGADACPDFAGATQIFSAQLEDLCVSDD